MGDVRTSRSLFAGIRKRIGQLRWFQLFKFVAMAFNKATPDRLFTAFSRRGPRVAKCRCRRLAQADKSKVERSTNKTRSLSSNVSPPCACLLASSSGRTTIMQVLVTEVQFFVQVPGLFPKSRIVSVTKLCVFPHFPWRKLESLEIQGDLDISMSWDVERSECLISCWLSSKNGRGMCIFPVETFWSGLGFSIWRLSCGGC